MAESKNIDKLFFANELSRKEAKEITQKALAGMDDGELYLESSTSESVSLDDGHIRSASANTGSGFGLRAVSGETVGFAHSSDITKQALKNAAKTVKAAKIGNESNVDLSPDMAQSKLYTEKNPILGFSFDKKVELLQAIDKYARAKDERVCQVSASIGASWKTVHIMRADEQDITDIRPMVRLSVSVIVQKDGRMESGYHGFGGRYLMDDLFDEAKWKAGVDEALRQALVNLEAIPAPAGNMPVVLGAGWPGVLLHEAVGHGLEGDFNRKGTSNFSGKIGEKVAAKGVTIIDDGTIANRRGSLTVDDEGTATNRTILIEDGILKGYMQDRMNARLMGEKSTGNGRRESYACSVLPRMTNTFMLGGDCAPEEIIASVEKGIYAPQFSGGQVDITSGKFTFSASEAYLIEKGKITAPIKGATLIGNGPDAMTKVTMLGNDMKLDPGIGMCGKDGQSVPVGVGQPTIKISEMTVGGTEM